MFIKKVKNTLNTSLLLLQLLLLSALLLNAEQNNDKILELPDFYVTASKYQEAIKDSPPNVYISSEEAIITQNFLNFEDVLKVKSKKLIDHQINPPTLLVKGYLLNTYSLQIKIEL